jgi:hypothetical protein
VTAHQDIIAEENLSMLHGAQASAATNQATFYGKAEGGTNTELWVVDGIANHTQLSAHWHDGAISKSFNAITGRGRIIDLDKQGRAMEALARGEIVAVEDREFYEATWRKPTDTWPALQARALAKSRAKRDEWDAIKTERDAWEADIESSEEPPPPTGDRPALHVAQPAPQWVTDSLKLNTAIAK